MSIAPILRLSTKKKSQVLLKTTLNCKSEVSLNPPSFCVRSQGRGPGQEVRPEPAELPPGSSDGRPAEQPGQGHG